MDAHAVAAERIEIEARADFFGAAPQEIATSLRLSSRVVGGVRAMASGALPTVKFNRAMGLGVEAPVSDPELDAAIRWLEEHAEGWALQIPPFALDRTLSHALARRGLVPIGNGWAKFLRTDPTPPEILRSDTIEVREARPSEASVFGRIVQQGFGLPETAAEWFAALVGRPRWGCSLAFVEGAPAASGAVFRQDGAAWLGMDATSPPYRGRGTQSHLIAHRISEALSGNVATITAETERSEADGAPGFESYRNYLRSGFRLAYVRPNYGRR